MFANEVVDSLEKFSKMLHERVYKDGVKSLIMKIKTSQKFHFGDLKRYDDVLDSIENDRLPFSKPAILKPRLPFPKCWFDVSINIEKETDEIMQKEFNLDPGEARGFLVEELVPTLLLRIVSFGKIKGDDMWGVTPVTFYVSLGQSFYDNQEVTQYVSSNKILFSEKLNGTSPNSNIRVTPLCNLPEEGVIRSTDTIRLAQELMALGLCEVFVNLLNCQNIVIENTENIEHKKIGKRVRKVFKGFDYHILKIQAPRTRKLHSEHSSQNEEVTLKRFHLCRGHFKTYTEDRPLFGKYVGTWWWGNQVKGSVEVGIIEKDYDVKNMKE